MKEFHQKKCDFFKGNESSNILAYVEDEISCPNFLILKRPITRKTRIPQTVITIEYAINNSHRGVLFLVAKSVLLLNVFSCK